MDQHPLAVTAERNVSSPRTPVVLFPAFHFTRPGVKMVNQTAFPECPASGTFEDWFLDDSPSTFSQVCQDKLLTLVYDPNPARPMAKRFSNPPGVSVKLLHFGRTASAPFYEPLYQFLEAAGYKRDANLRVAGHGSRLTPDEDAGLPLARKPAAFYTGFVEFAEPASFPNVDVYAEKGSGFETVVGLRLQDLSVGQLVTDTTVFFTRPDGDLNPEDITNDSIAVWQNMSCFRFELTDNPGVDHFALPGDNGAPAPAGQPATAEVGLPIAAAFHEVFCLI